MFFVILNKRNILLELNSFYSLAGLKNTVSNIKYTHF